MFDNHYIRIAGETVRKWTNVPLFAGDFFDDNGDLKSWSTFKNEMLLNDIDIFKWMQLRHAIPAKWKNIIKNDISSFQSTNGQLREQHVTHCSRNLPIDKFTSQTFYHILEYNYYK